MSKKSDKNVWRNFKFHENTAKYIKEEANRQGLTQSDLITRIFDSAPFALIEFNETVGKVSLKWWHPKGDIGETPTDPEKLYILYRSLRDNFEPVSAGIDYHKSFAIGGGFVTEVKNPLDKHEQEMRDLINEFNATVYQDYYTKGMDSINDIMIDEALTVGCAAAEIVYNNDDKFDFFKMEGRPDLVTEMRMVDPSNPENKNVYYVTRDLKAADWKKLGGIARLKFIDNAIIDLVPFRDPNSLDVRYWVLQKKDRSVTSPHVLGKPKTKELKKAEPLYLHPWQVFLQSWNRRGTKVKGVSIIKPVLATAALMKIVKESMGKGYKRWSDKKYFFICGTEKRPWGKVATRNFLKAMELMIKNNWTGIPVPTGFKIEEIGGDVLDARNFLDFLKGMICAGMHYPLDFLEQGKTAAGDKAWLAWQVTYGRAQLQIRRAIEDQLWQKHLWGIVGQRHREEKQGVRKGTGKWIPTFIPKLQWRSESKWHQDTRMKLNAQILNVASPVGPQLKLATEKDIAKIMGWGDVVFPTYGELEKALKKEEKVEKLEAENEKLKALVEQIKLEYLLSHPKLIQEMALPPEKDEEKEKTKEGKEKEEGVIEEKERQTEERLKGGVSRTGREKETKKGVAKLKSKKV